MNIILTPDQYFNVPSMWHPHPQGYPCGAGCYWPDDHWLTQEMKKALPDAKPLELKIKAHELKEQAEKQAKETGK